jgi:hypothetical protein
VQFLTKVPIEGVVTKQYGCRYDSWETDIVLWRYSGSKVEERIAFPGSICSASSADEMHTYWCDLETLVLCARGVRYALHLIDADHMDRKFRQPFGRSYLVDLLSGLVRCLRAGVFTRQQASGLDPPRIQDRVVRPPRAVIH